MPGYKKLGRPSAHRKSMLRNLVTDLFRVWKNSDYTGQS